MVPVRPRSVPTPRAKGTHINGTILPSAFVRKGLPEADTPKMHRDKQQHELYEDLRARVTPHSRQPYHPVQLSAPGPHVLHSSGHTVSRNT